MATPDEFKAGSQAGPEDSRSAVDDTPSLDPQEVELRCAVHRHRVTQWLCQAFEPGQARCCVIGPAGAGHLDLSRAIDHFKELHLVDVDASNIEQAAAIQGVDADRLASTIVGDLAGLSATLESLHELAKERELKFHDVQEAIEAAANNSPWEVPQEFDIVLSAETLGWVCAACSAVVGSDHPSLSDLIHAVRVWHVNELLRICRAGGYGLIINQLVSSRRMPSLPRVPPDKLEPLLSELVQNKTVSPGSSPVQLRDLLAHEAQFKNEFSVVHLLKPWMFDSGRIQFAMSGVSFQRRPEQEIEPDQADTTAQGDPSPSPDDSSV